MAWTAPRTWVAAEVVTAAILNQHVRDNLLMTAPAVVTAAGDLAYGTAANALGRLGIGGANSLLQSSGTAPQWATSLTGLDVRWKISAGGTITLTDYYRVYVVNVAAGVVTLPAANVAGAVVVVKCGVASATVQRAGTDVIFSSADNQMSLALALGDAYTLVANGGSTWYVV